MDLGATHGRPTAALTALAVLVASVLLGLLTPGSAEAAAAAPCPGRKVRTMTFSTGSVHVYNNHGMVCAYTVQKRPGASRRMSVSLQARGHRPRQLTGNRTARIGPIDVYAGHRWVLVRGSVGAGSASSGWFRA
ncbi:hypothetical protein ABZ330_02815 [Streptomyces sp. NPDC006172]|uniref:hypothetical protein n=1 Tax=Streptomyces sp. NPDC006172 TaxID=3154470 RepID=UPI003405865A